MRGVNISSCASWPNRHGFQVLDLLATFDACSGGRGETLRLYPKDPWHFDARAHSCAAGAIARFIERARELSEP